MDINGAPATDDRGQIGALLDRGATLGQLLALIDVVEHRGFTAAGGKSGAARLHHQVRRLEAALGVDVFDRSKARARPPALTPAGEQVLALARQIMAGVLRLNRVALAPGERLLSVAAYPAHVRVFAARASQAATMKDVEVRFHRLGDDLRRTAGDGMLRMLVDREVDVALAPKHARADKSAFVETPLYKWRLVAIPPLRAGHGAAITVPELVKHANRILCSPPGHASRKLLDAQVQKAGVVVRPYAESDNVAALRVLAREAGGWLVVPEDSLPVRERLRAVLLLSPSRAVLGGEYVAYRRRDETRREVLDFVKECALRTHGLGITNAMSRANRLAGTGPPRLHDLALWRPSSAPADEH